MDYMVPVSYGGNKIVPAPFVRLEKAFDRLPDGTKKAAGWRITVQGKVSATRGSPQANGSWWTGSGYPPEPDPADTAPELRVRNLRNKLGAMSALFSQDGLWFEIQPADGTAAIKFMPRIQSFDYAEGKWFDVVDFSVTMEADQVFFGGVSDPVFDPALEESWQAEPLDEYRPTYRVTHSLSATAKTLADGSAAGWERAKAVVEAALGFSGGMASTLGAGGSPWNHAVTKQADEANGRFSATETWVMSATAYTEDQTVEVTTAAESGVTTVRVSGTVTGLQSGDDPATRRTNAEARAATVAADASTLSAASAATTAALNPAPLSTTKAYNRPLGSVTYSTEYNTRPAVTPGYLSEQVTLTLDRAVPVVAQLPVVARPAGPVLQDTGSFTQKSLTVQFDIQVPVGYGLPAATAPVVDPLAQFVAYAGTPPTVYVASDRESWVARRGTFSRTTTYIFQDV